MDTPNKTLNENEELAGVLGLAVTQARAQRPGAGVREEALRVVAEKVRLERESSLHTRWSRSGWIAGLSAIAAVLVLVAMLPLWLEKTHKTVGMAVPANEPQRRGLSAPATNNVLHGETVPPDFDGTKQFGSVVADGQQHLGAIAAGVQPLGNSRMSAGTSPSRRMAIAGGATVIVSNGDEDPIELGQAVGGDMSKNFLHVWDWSKSKFSTPLKVSSPGPFAVSPDGSKIVTAEGRVIDAKTGDVATIDHFQGNIRGLKFSPDGRTLLLQVEDKESAVARLLEFPSGKMLCEIPEYWHYTFAAGFSADGKQVALMGSDRFIRRFDSTIGKELAKYEPAHSNSVRAIVISDDGKQLASCASSVGEIRVWNVGSGRLIHEYPVSQKPGGEKSVDSLAFSHDGKLLAGGGHYLVLWDVAGGNLIHTYPLVSWGARYIRFSADDKTITTIRDFSGTLKNGVDMLVYPTVQAYAVEAAETPERPKTPKNQAADQKKPAADLAPLIENIFKAYGGEEKLQKLTAMSETLRRFEGNDVVEVARYVVQVPNCYRVELSKPGDARTMICIFNGHGVRRWYKDAAGKTEEVILTGLEMADDYWLDYIKYFGPRAVLRLTEPDTKLSPIDDITLDGRTLAGIRVVPKTGTERTFYFDKETGLLAKQVVGGGEIYTDYKLFDGIPVASRRAEWPQDKLHPRHTESAEFKAVDKFDPAIFQKP